MTTQPGDRIGRFRLERELGRGGMGVVYVAVEETLGRRVALKVIAPQHAGDPEFRDRFVREARAQASLDSSHVVPVFAHGEEGGRVYIATQLVPDGDLGGLLRTAGPFPLGDGVALIEQIARGLCDAHEAGLVHRDIKPANVLLRRRRSGTLQAYLADFGIARRVDQDATRMGSRVVVAGTPNYMAPELHHGARASDSSDVYSLGCLLWMVLTGRPPYAGATDYEIVTAHLNDPVPQLDASTPLGLAVNRVLRLALAKTPDQRYPSALAFRDDLRSALRLPVYDDDHHAAAGPGTNNSTYRTPRSPTTPGAARRGVPEQPMPSVPAPWTPPASWGPPPEPPSAPPPVQPWTPPPSWGPPEAPRPVVGAGPPPHPGFANTGGLGSSWSPPPDQGRSAVFWLWVTIGVVAVVLLAVLLLLLLV